MTDNDSDFLDDMQALGLRPSMMDERVAATMSAAGFSQDEIVDFLATSERASFYRQFVRAHRLPCTPCVAMALRKSFDAGLSDERALQSVIVALRAEADELEAPPACRA